ncbi:MAG: N-acetyl-alpha-D-glucosaminyl L-malate synthase BshA [Bacteroidetes bacterium]|nr:N-acetyl-alpha-D-glucosaminyl L-malate synthase BshA [Bacteroidota bacterium]
MRIGMLCYPTFGGSGVLATELGMALAARGHVLHFISYKKPVRLDDTVPGMHYHNVHAEDYPVFDFLPYESALTSTLVDVAMREQLDVLHVHYAIPHASAALFAHHILKELGRFVPVVTTLHGTDITLVGREASYAPVVTYSINHSHAVTTVSSYLRQATLDHFEIRREIDVVHNFVDLGRFGKAPTDCKLRQILSPNGQTRILMHVSNFRPIKRIHDIIDMFVELRKRLPAKLILVGDGPDYPGIARRIKDEFLQCDILLLGKQEAVEDILPAADLFVVASEHESFGLSALEAMACGVPVLATRAGGLPEVIEPGRSGELVAVGDVPDMVRQAEHMLAQDSRLLMYKAKARLRAQQFSSKHIVPLYEDIYSRVCAADNVPH